jgi:hypothetical protein
VENVVATVVVDVVATVVVDVVATVVVDVGEGGKIDLTQITHKYPDCSSEEPSTARDRDIEGKRSLWLARAQDR